MTDTMTIEEAIKHLRTNAEFYSRQGTDYEKGIGSGFRHSADYIEKHRPALGDEKMAIEELLEKGLRECERKHSELVLNPFDKGFNQGLYILAKYIRDNRPALEAPADFRGSTHEEILQWLDEHPDFEMPEKPTEEAKPVLRFQMCTPEVGMTIYTLVDVKGERAWFATDDLWCYDKDECIKFAKSLGIPCVFEGEEVCDEK